MIKIYTDAAFDLSYHIASYCHVIVNDDTGTKEWKVYDLPDADSSSEAEKFGVFHAVLLARPLRKAGVEVAIYCDCMSALHDLKDEGKEIGVGLHHIKGHLLNTDKAIVVTDDRKFQHWADTMAYHRLKNRLDIISTSDNNEGVMETTK